MFQGFVRLIYIARAGLGSLSGLKLWCYDKFCLYIAVLVVTYVEGVGRL